MVEKKRKKRWASVLAGGIVAGLLSLGGCSGKPPSDIGVHDGRLSPCPQRPNCVASIDEGDGHYIEPILCRSGREVCLRVMKSVLRDMKNSKLVAEQDNYLHVEFRSKVMRFVDDVELYFEEENGRFQVRSAARFGYSDLGVNRKRMERIRGLFAARISTE